MTGTRYARSGDVHIAYQVIGNGPIDVVYVPGFVSNVEMWRDSPARPLVERLSLFSRLVLFDKRGTGLSDPVPVRELPTLEERMDDVRAVLDAIGSKRAAILGVSEGGPLAVLFAASYPDRVTHLVLAGCAARFAEGDDAPWGWSASRVETMLQFLEENWGTGKVLAALSPSTLSRDEAAYERRSASPGAVRAILKMVAETDVSGALGSLTVPTLVLHATRDPLVSVEAARYVAGRIPGARLVEADSSDHTVVWSNPELIDTVEEFVTGTVGAHEPDRILATILFTDIVGSTDHQASVGDRVWREKLDQYDDAADRQLTRFRGRKVKHTGDGILAMFDGPARAIKAALALRDAARQLGLETRSGVHTGECETRGDDIAGIAVSTASRVMDTAGGGEVVVSRTVTDLVAGSGLEFRDAGRHRLKGVPGDWDLFAVCG